MHYEDELQKLNEYQKEAVFDESNACLVNANVGSGKTTVLISKIMYLHYEKNVSFDDMIVLTFTNKAANEIKERLTKLDSSILPGGLQGFGTFHSIALYLLRSVLAVETLGYQKDFLVIEPEEELDLALEIIQTEKLKVKYKNRLKKRLEQASAIHNPDKMISKYDDDIFLLLEKLKVEKRKQNKMTFSDLLLNANQLLDDSVKKPAWIIIDEVQDSDKMQLELIDRLKDERTSLFAVGDPNQVIYSWRGSAFNVFYTLKEKYQAKELSLPINYRSSSSILEAAKKFLENGNQLVGIREPGNKIVVKKQYDSFNDACYLADRIKELHAMGTPYSEIAVFYRLQSQSKIFEDVFAKNQISFEVSQKKSIRDVPVLNWMIRLLRFSLHENDISSGVFVLSHKEYGEKLTPKKARKIIEEQGYEISKLYLKMHQFRQECVKIETAQEIFQYFELVQYLRPTSATYAEDEAAVLRLLEVMLTEIKEQQMPFLEGAMDFLNSSALYGINLFETKEETDSVKLMTLHASKGLEFSYVFITGVNYGLIPLLSRNFEDMEEERRLFFVGITRAKDYLELSYYTNPDMAYRAMPGESRYIHMIPEHLIQNDSENETKKNQTVDLQALKRQIQAEKMTASVKEDNAKTVEEEKAAIEPESKIVKKVKHEKYGTGVVVKEDETMIEVSFKGYGVKEFIKAFTELEYEEN